MELESFVPDLSRRRFLQTSGAAAAGTSAAALAACGGSSSKKQDKSVIAADVALLNSAIDLENTAIAAYTAGAPLLKGEVLKRGRELLGQEKEHADALSTIVTNLGGHPSRPKADYSFPRMRNQRDALVLADTIEHELIGAYLDALPRLSTPELRAQVVSIAANEAEHVSVLLGALGRPQAPTAFVTGKA
jgi:rubrerythrin